MQLNWLDVRRWYFVENETTNCCSDASLRHSFGLASGMLMSLRTSVSRYTRRKSWISVCRWAFASQKPNRHFSQIRSSRVFLFHRRDSNEIRCCLSCRMLSLSACRRRTKKREKKEEAEAEGKREKFTEKRKENRSARLMQYAHARTDKQKVSRVVNAYYQSHIERTSCDQFHH